MMLLLVDTESLTDAVSPMWMALIQVIKQICNKIPVPSLWPANPVPCMCLVYLVGEQALQDIGPLYYALFERNGHTKMGLIWKSLTIELARSIVSRTEETLLLWLPKASWPQEVPAISLEPASPADFHKRLCAGWQLVLCLGDFSLF